MHKVDFKTGVQQQQAERPCYMCAELGHDLLLEVEKGHYLADDLVMVTCQSCKSHYFLGDDPVLGYDYAGFDQDYWYNYVQNGAGISAMLEPLLAASRGRKGSLLDIGCGFGFVPHFWSYMNRGEAVGLEVSHYGVVGREKLGVNIIHEYYNEATEIHGKKFDYVFSSEVIEHVQDPKAFVKEIGQGLTEDGVLVLTTPSARGIYDGQDYTTLVAMLSPGFHYFVASRASLETLLIQAGYEHVLVRDSGTRLFAWASHKPLPEISDGFSDWPDYLDYLTKLAENGDKHIAGGALYRLFKDSLNLGLMDRAAPAYEKFETIAREKFNTDFRNIMTSEGWRTQRTDRSNDIYPSWLGCGIFFAGLFLHRAAAADLKTQCQLFLAATQVMKTELELAAQFAGEPAYFLPMAEEYLHKTETMLEAAG